MQPSPGGLQVRSRPAPRRVTASVSSHEPVSTALGWALGSGLPELDEPYTIAPQIGAYGRWRDLPGGVSAGLRAEAGSFLRDPGPEGTRVDVEPGDAAGYLRAICLGSFLDRLPGELHEAFVAAALERLPDAPTIHYVRLNILARRPL